MGFDIRWLVEGKVIYANLTGKIIVDDIRDNSKVAITMFESSDSPLVHVLVNEADLESLPISLKLFSDAADFLRHPQIGWMMEYQSVPIKSF